VRSPFSATTKLTSTKNQRSNATYTTGPQWTAMDLQKDRNGPQWTAMDLQMDRNGPQWIGGPALK